MAEAVGGVPVRLAPGAKAAYHAAAVLAAGGVVALLDAIAELGRVAGLDEAGSLAVYGPSSSRPSATPRAIGIRAALTGPLTRGDVGTLAGAPRRARAHAPACVELYRALARRELALAEARGALTPEGAELAPDAHLQTRPEPVGLPAMQHSIAAKYAARPAASFVRPTSRVRERRLGLRATRHVPARLGAGRPCCAGPTCRPSSGSAPAGAPSVPPDAPPGGWPPPAPSSRCAGRGSADPARVRRSGAAAAPWRG